MINLVAQAVRPAQQYLVDDEYVIEYCSPTCILRNLPSEYKVVIHGARRLPVVVDNKSLWVSITDHLHPIDHPLYMSEQHITVEERCNLLKRIHNLRPSHVATVLSLCSCTMQIEIIKGVQLSSYEPQPDWLEETRSKGLSEKSNDKLSWSDFVLIMRDLADGLKQLHSIGIAHGDAFPANALIAPGSVGVWVDLADILPATELNVSIDIWTFFTYTFLPKIFDIADCKPAAIRDAIRIIAANPIENILEDLVRHLTDSATVSPDGLIPVDEGTVWRHITTAVSENTYRRDDVLGVVIRVLTPRGLLGAYRAWQWNAGVAQRRERWLAAETVRHQLVEIELNRTLSERYKATIDELQKWVGELESAKAWLDEQRASWQRLAEEREATITELRNWTSELESAKTWLDEQRASWQRLAEERQATITELRSQLVEITARYERTLERRLARVLPQFK